MAQVIDLSSCRRLCSGEEQGVYNIVYVVEIAELFSCSKKLKRLALNDVPDPDAKESLSRILDAHPGPIGVGKPQCTGGDPVNIVVKKVVVLSGEFIDPVHIHRLNWVLFIYGKVPWLSVELAGAGEDDPDAGIVQATGFQDMQLRRCVDIKIGERICHRVEMTGLSCKIEKESAASNQASHRVRVPNIRNVDTDLVADVADVEEVPSVFGHKAVDEGDLCAERDEAAGKGRSDKSEPTRDQNVLASKMFQVG